MKSSRTDARVVVLMMLACCIILSCGYTASIAEVGSEPSAPTSIASAVNATLTAVAQSGNEQAAMTQIANVAPTLIAQALETLQPSAFPTKAAAAPTKRPTSTRPPAASNAPATAVPDEPISTATERPSPTNTPIPTDTFTPLPTNTPVPTNTPLPTNTPTSTFTPVPTNTPTPTLTRTPTRVPTHCPQQYCVIATDCQPGENTRAIGTIYQNDRPLNGVRVRVSYAYRGAPDVSDFISGHDPNNPSVLDPNHPGYYQLGMSEGSALNGDWWVFIVNDAGDAVSEGRYFHTEGEQTSTSCQIGITDFYK
jgi:hypothetical protein